MRWWAVGLIGLAALGPVAPRTGAAEEPASDEYKVKAATLYKLTPFIEWPARAFASREAPLVIGVLGADPFGSYIDEFMAGEKVDGRPLVVRRYAKVEDIKDCHILFIARSEAGALKTIFAQLKDRPLLTVGDSDNFTRDGGMIRLALVNGKIRLRISAEAAKSTEPRISSKILGPDTLVAPGKD